MKRDASTEDLHELLVRYDEWKDRIRARLDEFRAVPREQWFYELCYCLLTPQSKAVHADRVVALLEEHRFMQLDFDPTPLLHPEPSIYIRFHYTKARRLCEMKRQFDEIEALLLRPLPAKQSREQLVTLVKGIGLKEASHFLRNIGRLDVTIIDRHILKNLVAHRRIAFYPKTISARHYLELETEFERFAAEIGIAPAELDLLLWSKETGFILK